MQTQQRKRLRNDLYAKGFCHLFCPKCGNTTLFRPIKFRRLNREGRWEEKNKLKCSECGLVVPSVKGLAY